jgi:hypothetical protein
LVRRVFPSPGKEVFNGNLHKIPHFPDQYTPFKNKLKENPALGYFILIWGLKKY